MIGDVVGDPGLDVLEQQLPGLMGEFKADLTVVNGENAAGGFGLTEETLKRIVDAGADVITSGNHIWEKRDFWPVLDREERLLRPGNYPEGNPGHGFLRLEKSGASFLVMNLQGREYMTPIACPFTTFDRLFQDHSAPGGNVVGKTITIVDFHAESTKEKEAMGYYLDGRASLIAGTHTHVQTADERVLPQGTGYITDLGMTGITDGVIGMDKTICLDRARNQVLYRMECAKTGTSSLAGIFAEIDQETGRALSIRRVGKP
jgi:metallophosphoesterase (TIGR00282 family)